MTIYILKSDEIDWELLILDMNNPNISDRIYKKAFLIKKYEQPSIIDELFKLEDITNITFVACGLLFFYGKILLEYLQ